MGLISGLKNELRGPWAAGAWFSAYSAAVVHGAEGDTHLWEVDFLTCYMTLDRDETYTLTELANKLCAEVSKAENTTTVLIADDKRYVPRMKAGEQAVRASARAKVHASKGKAPAEPYPADAVLVPEGIQFTDEAGNAVQEEIDLNRMSLSRWYGDKDDPERWSNLGNDAWHSMHSDLQEHLAARGEQARECIFDHDAELGAVRFATLQAAGSGEWSTLRQEKTQPVHPLGEADTALAWWGAQYDGKVDAIHWKTTDTDLVAIYCFYHAKRTPAQRARTRFWWHCEQGVAVDLAQLIELMLAKEFMCEDGVKRTFPSPRALGIFLVFCGTDFQAHKLYAHRIGFEAMREAFLRLEWGGPAAVLPVSTAFERWLQLVHSRKLNGKPVQVPEAHRLPPTPLASLDSIRERYARDAPKRARERATRQRVAMNKLVKEHEAKLAPARAALEEAQRDSEGGIEHTSAYHRLAQLQCEADSEIEAKQRKDAEDAWEFPSRDQIEWVKRVHTWVCEYWAGAAQGKVPPEPQQLKRGAPAEAASSAAAAASSSSSPKRACIED